MRQIKFRFYHKKRNRIYEIYKIDFILEIVTCGIKNGTEEFYFSEGILIQFTGLKDKNGKEIYESDIVLYTCNEGTFQTVVKWGVKRHGFVLNVNLSTKKWNNIKIFSLPSLKYIEVIGNIYENSDLLS